MRGLQSSFAVVITLLTVLTGCGDGGVGSASSGSAGVVAATPLGATSNNGGSIASACPTGVSACSGEVLGAPVGTLQLSQNGVQAIGFSTSDLQATNSNTAEAFGLLPTNQGLAEVRVLQDGDANISAVDLLLSQLKLSWDGRTERPRIIENFGLKRGRVQLGEHGMSTLVGLPPSADGFWDNNATTFAGTQEHYANNHYYERSAPACESNAASCVAAANNGLRLTNGNWRSGGLKPDQINATRLHEDGATQAPDQVPFAGFKGYRDLWNWNYRYANVAGWVTKDTINIQEWGGGTEHNKERRGSIAFGQLTDPRTIPNSGSGRYRGYLRGWYSPDGLAAVYPIAADVEVTVDFGTQRASLQLVNLRIDEMLTPGTEPATQLTVGSTNALPFATPANTALGPIQHGSAAGYAGLRFFGPLSNGMPPELAGSLSIKGLSGITAIGGLIARYVAS